MEDSQAPAGCPRFPMALFMALPMWLWWSKPMGSHFGCSVNSPPIEPIVVVGVVDVHWEQPIWLLTHGHI